MKVLDLFSGLGGFSQAFRDREHEVITLDINPEFNPTICADVLDIEAEDLMRYGPFDIILAAPPCDEFSRESMPWTKTGKEPDLSLALKTKELIDELQPSWWIVENVRGAIPYFDRIFGKPYKRIGSRYFWGYFPIFYVPHDIAIGNKWRLPPTRNRKAIRSKIEYEISLSLCLAIENYSFQEAIA
ncbi:MAG: DNA cytosine methyltransferase [Thermoplasmata archaeon]|nr:DNA cytosine methyltransferase [Thermoplasmata archaeon]